MSTISSNTDQQAKTAYLAISATVINKFKCCITADNNVVENNGGNTRVSRSPRNVDNQDTQYDDVDLEVEIETSE